jgi:hypothetical protein
VAIIQTDLIHPDRSEPEDLVSWSRVRELLEELAEEQRTAFCRAFLPAARKHQHRGVRDAVKRAISEDPRAVLAMSMFGALANRHIRAYVLSRGGADAYEVLFDVWTGALVDVANPVIMALTGRFIVTTSMRPPWASDLKVANGILWFRRADVDHLTGLQGSDASRLRVARVVIAAYEKEHPGRAMPKRLFRIAMRKYFPGASIASLDHARIAARPEWKHDKGGRPRKT